MNRTKAYILCADAESNVNYAPWLNKLELPTEVIARVPTSWTIPEDAGILITHNQFQHGHVSAIRRATEADVPTLILADGILEYRNSWQNPTLPVGAVYRPVIGHKLACIGRSQARIIESWGNDGVAEVVGLPRLDQLCRQPNFKSHPSPNNSESRQSASRSKSEPFRIMVVTAKQPGFSPEQIDTTRRALLDLREWSRAASGDREIRLQWRVTGDLATELELKNELSSVEGFEFLEQCKSVDAVISTPSTAAVEAMLFGLPVALIDYYRCPLYVPTAWTIRQRGDIDPIVRELIDPPIGKLNYQEMILADSLECQSPASTRLIRLVNEMVAIGTHCRSNASPLKFPPRILEPDLRKANVRNSVSSAVMSPPITSDDVELSEQSALEEQSQELDDDTYDRQIESLKVELSHAEQLLVEHRESLDEHDKRLRRSGRHIERLVTRSEKLSQSLGATRSTLRKSDRRLETTKQRNESLTQSYRKETRSKRQTSKQLARAQRLERHKSALLEKKRRQVDRLSKIANRLKRKREESAKSLATMQVSLKSANAQLRSLHNELDQLNSHWFIGRVIGVWRWWKDRRQSNKTKE